MKYEWKKQDKDVYGVKSESTIITNAKHHYITIQGEGNPNDKVFSDKVSALYAFAYAIKMEYKAMMKNDSVADSFTDFTVYPLEGKWEAKKGIELIKEDLVYTIMIRQPDFITSEIIEKALEKVSKKKPNHLYEDIHFDSMEDGKSLAILHVGSYDDEPASFEKMDNYAKEHDFKRCKDWHREIYLNNSNRVIKSKLKTILSYVIE